MADDQTQAAAAAPEAKYRIQRPQPRRFNPRQKLSMAALLTGASLAALWVVWPDARRMPAVEASGVAEFQQETGGSSFGQIEQPLADGGGSETGFSNLAGELAAQRETLEGRNSALQAEVERLQTELSDLASRADAGQEATAKDLALALETAQARNLALFEEMRAEFRHDIAALRTASGPTDPAAAEREAELAARRAEREAQLQARVSSPSVIFDEGRSSNGAGRADTPMALEDRGGSRDAVGRDFVQSGREATRVEASQVMANPSNTVLQGTLIEATLENAVDSSLPGQLTAIVTRPVWSFDQAQILVPAGSRLFGDYSSEVSIGQGRILVAWTRLVTPDGQSVQMAAFGGDGQGRSGITGKANSASDSASGPPR